MSKEVKLGILAAVSIFLAVWGYRYIKGQNLFEENNTYYTSFPDVTGIGVSTEVTLNGYKIGAIQAISINPQDPKKMDIAFNIVGNYKFPKDTKILLKSSGIVSGKILAVSYGKPCQSDCAESGAYFDGVPVGLLGSMVSPEEISNYVSSASGELKDLINNLGAEGEPGAVNHAIRQLDEVITNLNALTGNLNKIATTSSNNISATMSNLNAITKNIAANNNQITSMLNNLNKTSEEISKIKLSNSMDTINTFVVESTKAVELLQNTLTSTNKSLKELEGVMGKLNDKNSTAGKLLNDDALYKDLDKTLDNLSLLLQDFRLNPKRYVNISVFGKNRPYTYPEGDPALDADILLDSLRN
ncbi:MAG: MCE family protein [Saprospiraceae bacterium]|nr:MCE family protein [Saprospiraceae bacterium]